MVIIETAVFTRLVQEVLTDEEYRKLQDILRFMPQVGDVIRGSGGLRKVRWSVAGRGKRGGVRVIYYWMTESGRILMLYIYQKNRQDDLTPDQLKQLKKIVEEEYHEKRNVC